MEKLIQHQNRLVFLAVCAFLQEDGYSHFSIANLSECGIGKETLVKILQRLEESNLIENYTVNGFFKRYKIKNYEECPEIVFDSRLPFGPKSFILDCYYNLKSFEKTSIRIVVKTLNNGTTTKYKAESNFNTAIKTNTGGDLFEYLNNMQMVIRKPSDPKYEVVWSENGYQLDTYYLQRREKYKQETITKRISKLEKHGFAKFLMDKVCTRVKKDGIPLANKLSIEDIEEVWTNQNGKDYFTGEPLEGNTGMSIDRIDSNGIYEKNNIVITTWEINRMKNVLSNERFILLCKKIANNFS